MNNDDELYNILLIISHQKDENVKKLLLPCVQHLVIKPRFYVLSIIKIILQNIIHEKIDIDITKFNKVLEQIKIWTFSGKSNSSTFSFWEFKKTNIFPDKIIKLFNASNIVINDLFETYFKYEDLQTAEDLTVAYVQEWVYPTKTSEINNVETYDKVDIIRHDNFKQGFNDRPTDGRGNGNNIETDTLTGKKLLQTMDKVNITFIQAVPEQRITDTAQINKILSILNIDNDIKLKKFIIDLWHGDSESSDNNIIYKMRENHENIKFNNLNNLQSRAALQTYIICIASGKTPRDVYDTLTILYNKIIPANLYDINTLKPCTDIAVLISKLLNIIILTPDKMYIRKYWENMKRPRISVSKVVREIELSDFDSVHKTEIIKKIKDIGVDEGDTKIKLAKIIRKIINAVSRKVTISEDSIKNMLVVKFNRPV